MQDMGGGIKSRIELLNKIRKIPPVLLKVIFIKIFSGLKISDTKPNHFSTPIAYKINSKFYLYH